MAGRIEIDDVAPVVSGGRFPAKAVVGEVVPVQATVWREGHDAVAATLVVRYHGTAYPRLAEDPPGVVRDRGSRCRSRRSSRPSPKVKPQLLPMAPGPRRPMCSTAQFTPDAVGLWTFRVDGWGDPIATWRKNVTPSSTPGRASRTGQRPADRRAVAGARGDGRAAAGPLSADRGRGPAARARRPVRPGGRGAVAARSTDLLRPLSAARTGHPRRAVRRLGRPPAGPLQLLVRVVPPLHRRLGRRGQPGARHVRHRDQGAAPHRARWASTSCTCRRSIRSARCTARAATTA